MHRIKMYLQSQKKYTADEQRKEAKKKFKTEKKDEEATNF